MGEVQRLQARVSALEAQLAQAHSELQARDAEVERLRRVNRELQLGVRGGPSETGVGVVSLASVEGDLAQLLERLRIARVQANAMQSPGAGDHGDVMRSPARARELAGKGNDAQLPPISDADEALLRHGVGGVGGADGGGADGDTEGDSASVGEEERHRDHGTDWTRRANSSAPFDTLSQASLNTDDGRLTYSNSEYTQHLGALSDQEEDAPYGTGAASPRSSVSLPATVVPPMLLDAHQAALQARRGAGVRS
jgi:hypothetical protein